MADGPAHGSFFRILASDELRRGLDNKSYFFTSTFSATEEVREELRLEFLKLLEKMSPKITKAAEKSVFHMNFDLFQVV